MATKADLQQLTSTIQDTLKAEMAGIRSEVASQANRITMLEQVAETQTSRLNAADTAVARQGDIVLAMRRHLEDLDNRGRRCNIRKLILQLASPQRFEFERAHRILRRRNLEEGPRDLICCLHSFRVKDAIMKKARERPMWPYRGAQISLLNDLSPLTLDAQRALRPVTTALRDRGITYKWCFPPALLARHNNAWIALC
ncbi:Hypothetical predicted protein [Pelobates cultripes]|uniref:Transposase n=1 Tax=Pelobates cultripes TaxID=61616 RepID=A0AAD1SEK7_PELCU|nr:Hypothetical predicted protein [Pelobates cultripes]